MALPLASIIIPVYNAQDYLSHCLDSIFAQTYKTIEIICVDDGSTDGSSIILKDYQRKHSDKMQVITQSNSGVAKARNKGIECTKGTYIFFVDNDDYIAADYIQKHVDAAEISGDDMIISGYKRVDENGKCVFYDKTKGNPLWEPFKRFAPWGRVYRRDFIERYNLRFLDNMIGEDDFFNIIAATKTEKVNVLDYVGYYWTFNTKSISNTQHVDIKLEKSAVFLMDTIYNNVDKEYLSRKGQYIEYAFIKFAVWFVLFYGNKMTTERLKQAYIDLFSTVQKYFPSYKRNKFIGIMTPKGEYYKTRLAVCFFMVMEKLHMSAMFIKLFSRKKMAC